MNTTQNSESPLVSNKDTAPAYWLLDSLWVILVDGEQSGGRFSIMEQCDARAWARSTITDRKVMNFFFSGREAFEKVMANDLIIFKIWNCMKERIGVTGFCLGGGLAYQVSTRVELIVLLLQ